MENTKFKWIEFCADIHNRDMKMVEVDKLTKEMAQCGDVPMFSGRYMFDNSMYPFGSCLSNFYCDFDCEEDPQRALAQLKDAAEYFIDAGVDEDKLKLRFTGGKGGSIEVPFGCFEAKPSGILPQIWEKIAKDLKRDKHWNTLDLSVYDCTRLWRITGTRHKSGLFKIPITIEDIEEKKLDGIRKDAKNRPKLKPYEDDREVKVSHCPKLSAAYTDAKRAINDEAKEFKKRVKERVEAISEPFPCVETVIKSGVDAGEFQRNPTAFNLAVSLCQVGLSDDEIMSRLVEFAGNCRPPMPEDRYDELMHCIEMARGHDYVTHCGTPVFEAHCVGKKNCWVFQKKVELDDEAEAEAAKAEEFDADTVAKAEEFLNDPMNVNRVEYALSDVVKEEDLTMSIFILILSGQSIQVGGESSTGKSHIVDVVIVCFPKKWVEMLTGVSDRTVRYLGKEVRILYIKEMKGTKVGSDTESSAEFDIKQGISEGELSIRVTISDPKTGKFRTQIVKTAFGCFVSTTTDVGITPELQNRMWELATKESISRDVSSHLINQMGLPKSMKLDRSPERKVIRCAMEILDKEAPKDFIIPFSEDLIEIMSVFGNQPRIRRDVQKLGKVICGFAKLNYRNRPTYDDNGLKHIICMPIDLYWAIKYLWPAILGTFSGSTKRAEAVYETAMKIVDAGKRLDSATLASMLGITQRMALNWLKRFANEGKLIEGARDSKGVAYSVIRNMDSGAERTRNITIPYIKNRTNYYKGVKLLNAANILPPRTVHSEVWNIECEDWVPDAYKNFSITIPAPPISDLPNVEDFPDAPVQVAGMLDSGRMTVAEMADILNDSVPYGGVSTEICWTIIKGRRFYRCPKCHHRLYLSLVDDDLHCHNCGHVEYVEYGDPEEFE